MAKGSSTWLSARDRMKSFPKALVSCSAEATIYAKCVSTRNNLKKDDCQKQFVAMKTCFEKVMKRR
ncbi:hypothetical protein LSH36_734g01013 [Paralvinella palmiformis]|uniref:Uncharacterized protein n=1 Tax=Paralvinella palmiformis TaxID=53620 RepID=A0AAD9MTE0_9ANNE|nr:hypothetical protein LSH36_734g01013 [Paralvinella palmiformis]